MNEKEAYEILKEYSKECKECSLHKECKNTFWGTSPETEYEKKNFYKIFFIDDVFCETVEEDDEQYVKAWQMFEELFYEEGIDTGEYYHISNIMCYPVEKNKLTDKQYETCLKYLDAKIAYHKPQLIVSLGKDTTEKLLNKKVKVTKDACKIVGKREDIPVLMMLHPTYVQKNTRRWLSTYKKHVKLLSKNIERIINED